jgi:agmatine/peptidylarginine deiminase
MARTDFRLPAEWERQSATLLAWPHDQAHWGQHLSAVQDEYVSLIVAILARQNVVLLVPPGMQQITGLADHAALHRIEVPYNDTWCRDYGPITLVHVGDRLALDFYFDGWGGKYPASHDNRVNTLLARQELFNRLKFRQYLFALEGGAIEPDGQGRLLVNWHCLHTRQPHLSRKEISHELHVLLNIDEVIGVDIKPMSGDDTDGHIDTIARFINPETIVWQSQADSQRNEMLQAQLEALRTVDGKPHELIALPVPRGIDETLPASYANFIFINKACLVPAYGADNDDQALHILAEALPDREVEAVPARAMISQFGGPHCATMHLPAALG